jgi:AraC-like DNA-binding protein
MRHADATFTPHKEAPGSSASCSVLDTIEKHYANPQMSVSFVARILHRSPSYVARQLRSRTNVGFVSHLRGRRMAAAYRLMQEPTLSIKQIAAAVGYHSRRQFERDVRNVFNATASDMRTRAANRKH